MASPRIGAFLGYYFPGDSSQVGKLEGSLSILILSSLIGQAYFHQACRARLHAAAESASSAPPSALTNILPLIGRTEFASTDVKLSGIWNAKVTPVAA